MTAAYTTAGAVRREPWFCAMVGRIIQSRHCKAPFGRDAPERWKRRREGATLRGVKVPRSSATRAGIAGAGCVVSGGQAGSVFRRAAAVGSPGQPSGQVGFAVGYAARPHPHPAGAFARHAPPLQGAAGNAGTGGSLFFVKKLDRSHVAALRFHGAPCAAGAAIYLPEAAFAFAVITAPKISASIWSAISLRWYLAASRARATPSGPSCAPAPARRQWVRDCRGMPPRRRLAFPGLSGLSRQLHGLRDTPPTKHAKPPPKWAAYLCHVSLTLFRCAYTKRQPKYRATLAAPAHQRFQDSRPKETYRAH